MTDMSIFENRNLVDALLVWINDPKDYASIARINKCARLVARHHRRRFINIQFKYVAIFADLRDGYEYDFLICDKISEVYAKAKPNLVLKCMYYSHIEFTRYIQGLKCKEDHVIIANGNREEGQECFECQNKMQRLDEFTPIKLRCRFTKCIMTLNYNGTDDMHFVPKDKKQDDYLYFLPMNKYLLRPIDGKMKLHMGIGAATITPQTIQARDDSAMWKGVMIDEIRADVRNRVLKRYAPGVDDGDFVVRVFNMGFLESGNKPKKIMGTVSWYTGLKTFNLMYGALPHPPPGRFLVASAERITVRRGRSRSF